VVLTLLFGIVIGRLVRRQSTPKAQVQPELRPRYEQIQTIVESVQNPAARRYLDPRLDALRKDIDAAQKTAEALRADVESLETEALFLADLERIESEFQTNRLLLPHKPKLQPGIDKDRSSLISGKKDEAGELLLCRLMIAKTSGSRGSDAQA
jgi:uncharacterized membrane-anchored protein YhcB (DUF1043 family)